MSFDTDAKHSFLKAGPQRQSVLPHYAILLAAMLFLTGCGVPGATTPADRFNLDFSMPKDAQVRGAILFVVDGVNPDIFEQMLNAGQLPHLKKYFVDRGTYYSHAIANTPAVTLPNLTSIVTGQFPGHTNITGVNWFDRNQLIWRDYGTITQKNTLDGDYIAPNIFEQFPDEYTVSDFFQPHRGATKWIENRYTAVGLYAFGWYGLTDRLTLSRWDQVMDMARKQRRFPMISVNYLLMTDFTAYEHGASSEEYREALRHTDMAIGRFLADMERAGLLDKINIALTSDHGHFDVKQHFHMADYLEQDIGLDLDKGHWWENRPFETRLADYDHVSCVQYGSGDRYFALCLRHPIRENSKFVRWDSWLARPHMEDLENFPARRRYQPMSAQRNVNLLDTLTKLEPVDAIAYSAGEDRVRVRRKSGEVEFLQQGGRDGKIVYRVVSGEDPLGWKGKVPQASLEGQPMTGREWLNATAACEYPDLPAQILAYFRSRRAGDIIMFAVPGWDFNHANKSGHGGIRRGDMCVPLLIAGPNVPHQAGNVARTVDVMPTILTILGYPVPPGLDGQSLLPRPNH